MLIRRLPFTRRISLTCIARSSYPAPIESELREAPSTMAAEYPQKAALDTGGSQGIGKDIARLLVQRGYRVAAADLKDTREDARPKDVTAAIPSTRSDLSPAPPD